jgi:hypothetical protein
MVRAVQDILYLSVGQVSWHAASLRAQRRSGDTQDDYLFTFGSTQILAPLYV